MTVPRLEGMLRKHVAPLLLFVSILLLLLLNTKHKFYKLYNWIFSVVYYRMFCSKKLNFPVEAARVAMGGVFR